MNDKRCKKCGYEWMSRKDNPKTCPECKARLGTHKKLEDKVEENKNDAERFNKEGMYKGENRDF